jgi:hypothetical protein
MPHQFLNEFVRPTIAEWHAHRSDVRPATIAICQLDILAEHCIRHFLGGGASRKDITDERNRHGQLRKMVEIVRDAHDTHKHGPLTRRNARITRGQTPHVVDSGGEIGATPIGAAAVGGGTPELALVLDDGSSYPVDHVIADVLDYWTTHLRP